MWHSGGICENDGPVGRPAVFDQEPVADARVALALLFTIALGIGSNAAVVGFVRGLVTRDLPVPGIEAMVSLFARDAAGRASGRCRTTPSYR